jgi:hypothetical protein
LLIAVLVSAVIALALSALLYVRWQDRVAAEAPPPRGGRP